MLRINDLRVGFDLPEGRLIAVDGVSFQVPRGSTVALVGESGSGKTVVSQTIMGLLPKAAKVFGGSVLFADPDKKGTITDIVRLPQNSREMRALRGGRISIIFQEPMTSLSPLHTVGDQIREALMLHRPVGAREADELTEDMLRMVVVGTILGVIGQLFELQIPCGKIDTKHTKQYFKLERAKFC